MTKARSLSDADIKAIVVAIRGVEKSEHDCRFQAIDPAELSEVVIFVRHFNKIMTEGGSTIRKTILVIGVSGLVAILSLGAISKIKTSLGL